MAEQKTADEVSDVAHGAHQDAPKAGPVHEWKLWGRLFRDLSLLGDIGAWLGGIAALLGGIVKLLSFFGVPAFSALLSSLRETADPWIVWSQNMVPFGIRLFGFISIVALLLACIGVAIWIRVAYRSRFQRIYRVSLGLIGPLVLVALVTGFINIPVSSAAHVSTPSTNPYPPKQGSLVLNGMSSRIWQTDADATGACSLVGSAYRVTATKGGVLHICPGQHTDFGNLALEVNITFLQPGEAGIFFRAATIGGHATFYELSLESYGYIFLYAVTPSGAIRKLGDEGIPPNVFDQTIGAANKLAVSMNGSRIIVYVNNVQLLSAIDDTNSRGSLAVYAAVSPDHNESKVEVVFSDMKAWAW